jgi:hypothetical protein
MSSSSTTGPNRSTKRQSWHAGIDCSCFGRAWYVDSYHQNIYVLTSSSKQADELPATTPLTDYQKASITAPQYPPVSIQPSSQWAGQSYVPPASTDTGTAAPLPHEVTSQVPPGSVVALNVIEPGQIYGDTGYRGSTIQPVRRTPSPVLSSKLPHGKQRRAGGLPSTVMAQPSANSNVSVSQGTSVGGTHGSGGSEAQWSGRPESGILVPITRYSSDTASSESRSIS